MKAQAALEALPRSAPDFFSPHVSEARRFYLELNPPKDRSLAVVCGGVERSTADYAIHRTSFSFYAIEYVTRGRGSVRLQGEEHPLQPGRLFSYGPGIRQDIVGDPAEPLVKYFVNFTGRQAKALLEGCGLPPGSVAQVFPPTELQAVFEELIHCGLKGTRYSGPVCAKLLECLGLKIAESRAPLEGTERLAFTTYQQARQHIQQHFQRLRTLEQISAECHVNNAYLCRLFRRYDHQSPYQFLLRLKMNFAAERLQRPEALVKQVAEETGFGDAFHFSRAFKSVFGLSPDAFRRLR
ncbi:MAG TPA: AraC family transcriptional regulator [Bacillota bacterium]|nr:AraC family transcriptional regulator [Bacillota bacterium]